MNLLWIFDKNKILILKELFKCKNCLIGCDLREKLDIKKNLLSYHLKILIDKGFVTEKKDGRTKRYRLAEGKRKKVKEVLEVLEIL